MNLELIDFLKRNKEYGLGLFILIINLTASLCSGIFINKFIDETGGSPHFFFSLLFNVCVVISVLLAIIYHRKLVLVLSGISCLWLVFVLFKFIIYCNNILISMSNP